MSIASSPSSLSLSGESGEKQWKRREGDDAADHDGWNRTTNRLFVDEHSFVSVFSLSLVESSENGEKETMLPTTTDGMGNEWATRR